MLLPTLSHAKAAPHPSAIVHGRRRRSNAMDDAPPQPVVRRPLPAVSAQSMPCALRRAPAPSSPARTQARQTTSLPSRATMTASRALSTLQGQGHNPPGWFIRHTTELKVAASYSLQTTFARRQAAEVPRVQNHLSYLPEPAHRRRRHRRLLRAHGRLPCVGHADAACSAPRPGRPRPPPS